MALDSDPRPRLSRTIHAAYTEFDGLLYASSMNGNKEAVALYERTRDALPTSPEANMPLAHPGLRPDLERFADELGYDMLLGRGAFPVGEE